MLCVNEVLLGLNCGSLCVCCVDVFWGLEKHSSR